MKDIEGVCAKLFTAGNLVVVDPDLRETRKGECVTTDMLNYKDCVHTISYVDKNCYHLSKNIYNWQDFMLLPVEYEAFESEGLGGEDAENFKIGDHVVIHPDLEESDRGYEVTEDMLKYAGKVARIIEWHGNHYHLDVDNQLYGWQDYMLLRIGERGAAEINKDEFLKLL